MFTETFNRKNDYYPSYSRKKYEEVTIVYDRPFTTATINGYYYDISKAFNCLYPGITDGEGFEKIVDKYKLNFPDTISVKIGNTGKYRIPDERVKVMEALDKIIRANRKENVEKVKKFMIDFIADRRAWKIS